MSESVAGTEPAATVRAAISTERLRDVRDRLTEGLVERDVAMRLALLAAIAGEHLLLLGPPGTAKSLLARRLKLTCVATGIATPAQLAFLRKNGCDQGQGPLVGEPLPGLPFAAKWLTRSGRPPRVPLPSDG